MMEKRKVMKQLEIDSNSIKADMIDTGGGMFGRGVQKVRKGMFGTTIRDVGHKGMFGMQKGDPKKLAEQRMKDCIDIHVDQGLPRHIARQICSGNAKRL